MLLFRQLSLLTTLVLATFSSCIEQKDANPNAMLALLYPREVVEESYTLTKDWNGCMMTFQKGTTKLSFCFEVPRESCKPSYFINIPDSQTLQNRKDDLSFLALNFTNCTSYTSSLSNLYDTIQPPASTFIERISSYPGPMNESDFTVTYRENCSYNTIKVEQNTGFQRFFTSDEFTSQNRIEAELGWMNGTTKQCLIDLSQSQTTIDLSFAVRSKTILPGAVCSLVSGSSIATCPWSK